MPDNERLLKDALQLAVPLIIAELQGTSYGERARLIEGAGQYIAEHGDDVLYRSSRPGDTAKAFSVLARSLAVLAYQPGGVTFAGLHWCTDHAQCEAADKVAGSHIHEDDGTVEGCPGCFSEPEREAGL